MQYPQAVQDTVLIVSTLSQTCESLSISCAVSGIGASNILRFSATVQRTHAGKNNRSVLHTHTPAECQINGVRVVFFAHNFECGIGQVGDTSSRTGSMIMQGMSRRVSSS